MKILIVLLAAAIEACIFKKESIDQGNIGGVLPSSCQSSPYRSFDGSCNNLAHPEWGTPFSAYARLIKNSYSDGVHAFPRDGKKPLINPRDLSLQVSPDVINKDPIWTVITLQWGQSLAHDMSLTALPPRSNITCCTNGQPLPKEMDASCAPIAFTVKDQYNAPEGNTCFDFFRTITNKDQGCYVPGKAKEPLSSVTALHDFSLVYGNTEVQSNQIRAFNNGKLTSVERHGEQWLPQNPNPAACNVRSPGEPCYLAGDVRVNQHPHLALVQTILMREHNRIAEELCTLVNPHWDDERCFQEARRILIAKGQHITYTEFLPIFLGLQNMVDKGLAYPNATGFIDDHDQSVNPQTLIEHATAVFRALHSLIVGQLKVYSESRDVIDYIRFSDWLNRPSLIEVIQAGLARGLCTQQQNANDRFYDDEITQYFNRGNRTTGEDLHATDMQRSRDHGVGTYVQMLHTCGLGKPKCFSDLEKYMKREYVELLERLYNKVENVELATAILLETKVTGTLSGPVSLCIMLEQFRRTRVGDRFFYENTENGLTDKQLNSIRTTKMSRMFCDNVKGLESMQLMAFEIISETNALVPCSNLPQEDLFLWKENPEISDANSAGYTTNEPSTTAQVD